MQLDSIFALRRLFYDLIIIVSKSIFDLKLVSHAELVKGARVLRSLPLCRHCPVLVELLFEIFYVLNRTTKLD